MLKIKSIFICFTLLFLQSIVVQSQSNGLLVEQSLDIKIPFTITQFSTKNGLPQSRVVDIVSKDNGNLIILTANGIVEYNGREFNPFIKEEKYKSTFYAQLFWHDATNTLFAISDKGLNQIYPGYKVWEEFKACCLYKDSMYCINKSGDIFSAKVSELKFRCIYKTGVKKAQCLLVDAQSCFVGSAEGLYDYNKRLRSAKKLYTENFYKIKRSPIDSVVYGLGLKEVIKLDSGKVFMVLDLKELGNQGVVRDIDFIDATEFYVSTTYGLYEINIDYTDHYTNKRALPTSYLLALHYNSKENCLFVGSGEKGLLKLQFKNCFTFTSKQGFAEGSSLSSIIRSPSGKVVVGGDRGMLYQFNIDTVVRLTQVETDCASLGEINGNICVGTWDKGVLILKETRVTDSVCYPVQLPDPAVHAMFKDSKGNIWMGTGKGLAMGKNFKDIRPFMNDRIRQRVICFYELNNKSICIGGNEGVYILDRDYKLVLQLGSKQGLKGKEVRSFYEDSEGKLWIGTYDGGLYCYFKNKLTNINQLKNSKLDADAFCLAQDGLGYIYMSSNHGLWRISEKKLNDFYKGKIDYLIPFYYGEETGIVNTEFNGGFSNNFLKSRMNHLYFPSIEGVVIVNPEEANFRKLNPKIDKIYVNDTLHDFSIKELNNKTFSIDFNFSCLSYLEKYNVYYQYKLESEKRSEWSSLQKNASVDFKMLPAGHYTFSVRALDAFNDEDPNVVSYAFVIRPVFYDTLGFKLFAFIFVLSSASIIIRMRIRRFRREAEEKERVRRQLAEFELKATHAQMNPHFIFNSLNSIKYYLTVNDQKNADNYIDHFSSLLRSFLENGSKDFIELNKEIEILSSYIELEKQRMNPSFSSELFAEHNLLHLSIPTHVVQPFVENAIKHGINHSEKKCHLIVKFYRENNYLVCLIDDDGIGRERSRKINSSRVDHQSKGLEMVMEKIRIVKEIYKFEILLSIVDKEDEMQQAKGTRVEIKIPLITNENSNS